MYYLELIQRFWEFNKTAKISPTEISVYLYLLKIGYENDRYDFKISDVKLGKELGLTRKTIKSTKERLKSLRLIEIQTANGLPCHYRLLLNYSFNIESKKLNEKEENTNNEKSRKTETLEIPVNILSVQPVFESVSEIKTQNDEKIFSETPLQQEQKQKQEQQNLKNCKIPSLNEFMKYAKSLETFEPELELSISEKYKSWKNNGWKNTSNRPISNWKSTLKSTLPYLKNSHEENLISLQDIPNIKRPESDSKNH